MKTTPRAGRYRFALICVFAFFAVGKTDAALILNDPLPIEHRVTVQLIQTGTDDGQQWATAFGTASQRAEIQENVNLIWAQAGVQVVFNPIINRLASSKAYDQSLSLYEINVEGGAAGVRAPSWTTLNLYLVQELPMHGGHSPNSVSGVASVSANGIALFVGSNALNSGYGREIIAEVTAHEIGHNLGLWHSSESGNLMDDGAKLNAGQIATVKASSFVLPALPLAGDFNSDGMVDAADYSAWRDGLGTIYSESDYDVWRSSFAGVTGAATPAATAAPEPHAALLAAACLLLYGAVSRSLPSASRT